MADWTQDEFDATEREVVSMEWEGKQARAVVTRRTYATDIEDLWDAIVTPERLGRWLHPVSGDLREGGTYQLEGNAGGTITRCDRPSLLAVTWEMHGSIGWVNVKLSSVAEGATLMTLEHIAHDEADFLAFWKRFGPGSLGVGWELGLLALVDHLRSGGDTFVVDEASWMASEIGHRFVKAVSKAWVEADIAFGTDPDEAREAGQHTFDFFTERGSK